MERQVLELLANERHYDFVLRVYDNLTEEQIAEHTKMLQKIREALRAILG